MRYLLGLLALIGVLSSGISAQAAATFDASSRASCNASETPCVVNGGFSTLTYAHTVGSGTSKELGVFAFVGCNTGDTAPTVTGITYNGQALTSIVADTTNAAWKGYLFAWPTGSEPTSGAHNVVVTLSGNLTSCTLGGVKSIQSWAASAQGVDQTTTFTSSGSASGTGAAAALTLSSSQAGDLGIEAVCGGNGVTSTTETVQVTNTFTHNGCGSLGGATAGGTDTSFSWVVPADHWILIGAAFKGATGGTAPVIGTVDWTANTESDLAGYNLRRCTGAACTPTVLLATVSAPTHTYTDNTLVAGTTYVYSINAFDTTGNQSLFSTPGVSFVAGSAPPTPPKILTATFDATGANVTWSGPPTSIRVAETPGGASVIYSLSAFPAGRLTYTWRAGDTSACLYAIDGAGLENDVSTDFKCGTLVGIAPPLDTTPPVLSNALPTAALPAGTTSTSISVTRNEPGVCSYDTTDVAYISMANTMATASLVSSATVTGLTDGSTHTYYVRCLDVLQNANTSSTVITVTVSVSTADTTPPTTVAGVSATAVGATQATVVWNIATDAGGLAGYKVYSCVGVGCATFTLNQSVGAVLTAAVTNLSPLTSYSFVVRAIDTSNNLSAADSNVSTITTTSAPDTVPPLPMTNLRLASAFTQSALLAWDPGVDDSGTTFASIEQCTGSGCTNFAVSGNASGIVGQSLFKFLSANTTYRFRGLFTDGSGNVSVAYSNIIEITTSSTGLAMPRASATTDRTALSTARTARQ